jgi:hypothetical protein
MNRPEMTRNAVALVVIAISLLTTACNKAKPTSPGPGTGTNSVSNSVRFTRQDSSVIVMGPAYAICCAIWEPGYVDKMAFKILFYDSLGVQGGWKLFLLLDEAKQDTSYALPTTGVGQSHVSMFVFDLETGNEANSAQSVSSGTITLHSFSCGPPVRIDATVDAVLGSELGGGAPIRAQGRLTGAVYTNPLGCAFSF